MDEGDSGVKIKGFRPKLAQHVKEVYLKGF